MSREAYTPGALNNQNTSTTGSGSGTGTGGSASYSGFALTGGDQYVDTAREVQYLCGDCDSKVSLKKSDPIRCKECGYRVLYKERTNR